MTSKVDIVNQALAQIGAQASVSSINPSDGSTEANIASLLYEPKIEALFRAAHWNFARKQILMTQVRAAVINGVASDDPPIQPWLYEYAYPSDCIAARFIMPYVNTADTISPPLTTYDNLSPTYFYAPVPKFIVGASTDLQGNPTRAIFCNVYQAQLVYTMRVDNPDLWDPAFQNAATATLSAWFVNALSRNRELMQDCINQAMVIVNQARVSDGDEGITSQDHIPDWMTVRGVPNIFVGAGYYGWSSINWPNGAYY